MTASTQQLVRFGILGTGRIAHDFVTAMRGVVQDATVVAVGSRNSSSAEKFAREHNIAKFYDSYENLVNDTDVDVVYVATPHSEHLHHVLLAVRAGKHVLCEKSFALNEAQALQMIKEARQRNVFLMEANWMVFFPLIRKTLELVQSGAIGEVVSLQASLGFSTSPEAVPSLFDNKTGGGSLLACGVYAVSFAQLVLGIGKKPEQLHAVGQVGSTQVDEHVSILLSFAGEGARTQTAMLSSSIVSALPSDAVVVGTKGSIKLHGLFCCPMRITLSLVGKEDQVFEEALPSTPEQKRFNYPNSEGLAYEAQHVVDCIRAGKTESSLCPLSLTLASMSIMDSVRHQLGFKFHGEDM